MIYGEISEWNLKHACTVDDIPIIKDKKKIASSKKTRPISGQEAQLPLRFVSPCFDMHFKIEFVIYPNAQVLVLEYLTRSIQVTLIVTILKLR